MLLLACVHLWALTIVADADDVEGLEAMTARSKVVLSTAGPFHRYGSNLVAACVKNATHYVDITGENFWVKGLIEKHHAEASAKGIRIIPSCGFDSIPSDLGAFFSAQAIGKPIKRIESFHSYKGGASGGTLETMFSMGELDLGDDLTNPFLLNPEDSYSDEQMQLSSDRVGIAKKSEINAWFKRMKEMDPFFDYELMLNEQKEIIGVVWMTGQMRRDLEDLGDHLNLDMMKKETNTRAFFYMLPLYYNVQTDHFVLHVKPYC